MVGCFICKKISGMCFFDYDKCIRNKKCIKCVLKLLYKAKKAFNPKAENPCHYVAG